jgi:ABC-type branched-subunit amino acid transport system permease subunit
MAGAMPPDVCYLALGPFPVSRVALHVRLSPQLIQQLFNGLSLGAIYALIAIGYTMVYGIIGMINFAHGDIYMIGAYIGLVTLSAIGTQSGCPYGPSSA